MPFDPTKYGLKPAVPSPSGFDPAKYGLTPIASAAPTAPEVVNAQHPELTLGQRTLLKNLGTSPEAQRRYLEQKLGFETDADERGDVLLRKPGETSWYKIEKHGLELADIPDIATDITSALATTGGAIGGGALGLAVGGPPGMVAGGIAGAGAASGGHEAQRRALARAAGVGETDIGRDIAGVAEEAAYGAAAEATGQAVGAGFRALKGARMRGKLAPVKAAEAGRTVQVPGVTKTADVLRARIEEMGVSPTALKIKPRLKPAAQVAAEEAAPEAMGRTMREAMARAEAAGVGGAGAGAVSEMEHLARTQHEITAAKRGAGVPRRQAVAKYKGGLEAAQAHAQKQEADWLTKHPALPEISMPILERAEPGAYRLTRQAAEKLISEKMSGRTLREWAGQLGMKDAWKMEGAGPAAKYVLSDERLAQKMIQDIWKLEDVVVARRTMLHDQVFETTQNREVFEAVFRKRGGEVRHMLASTNPPPQAKPINEAVIREGLQALSDKYGLDEARAFVSRFWYSGKKVGPRVKAEIAEMDVDELAARLWASQKSAIKKKGFSFNPKEFGLLTVWDREAKAWRFLDLDTVLEFRRVGQEPIRLGSAGAWEPQSKLYKVAKFIRGAGERAQKPMAWAERLGETVAGTMLGEDMAKMGGRAASYYGLYQTGPIGQTALAVGGAGRIASALSRKVMRLQLRQLDEAPLAIRTLTKPVRALFRQDPKRARMALYLLVKKHKELRDWLATQPESE